ncbi:MAG: ATP-binding cassette domain-containing protein [Terriglobia bacterium]
MEFSPLSKGNHTSSRVRHARVLIVHHAIHRRAVGAPHTTGGERCRASSENPSTRTLCQQPGYTSGIHARSAPTPKNGNHFADGRPDSRRAGQAARRQHSLALYRREVLAVTGPSGSGKTSFLRLLNRLDEATGGAVYFEEEDTRAIPPRELRRRIGMVTQTPYLFPGTTSGR